MDLVNFANSNKFEEMADEKVLVVFLYNLYRPVDY